MQQVQGIRGGNDELAARFVEEGPQAYTRGTADDTACLKQVLSVHVRYCWPTSLLGEVLLHHGALTCCIQSDCAPAWPPWMSVFR